jgi:hypothetical protein
MLDLILMIIIDIHDGLSPSQEVGHHGDCLGYRQQITCLQGLSVEFCCCWWSLYLVPLKLNTWIKISHNVHLHFCSHCRMKHGKEPLPTGVRYSPDKEKYFVERRPHLFKKKLWLGSYRTKEDALIANDVCTFYIEEQEQMPQARFAYICSLEWLAALPPLSMKFSSLDPTCTGGHHCEYSSELRERIRFCIEKDREMQWTKRGCRVSDDNKNTSTSQTLTVDQCPAVLNSNTYQAPFCDHPSEAKQTEMPEDAASYDYDWLPPTDNEDTSQIPLLSPNQIADLYNDLPSDVLFYNCSDTIPGKEIDAQNLGTGPFYPAIPPEMTITINELLARGGGLASFEIIGSADINPQEGGQNLHINSSLDVPFTSEASDKSMGT